MSLPKMEVGQKEMRLSFKDPQEMLKALQDGVKELGEGAIILPADQPPALGFVLSKGTSEDRLDWWHSISLMDFKANFHSLTPKIFDNMTTARGRVELAAYLNWGMTLGHIEAFLSDTVVSFILNRAHEMEARAMAEQDKAPVRENGGGRQIFGSLGLHPGGTAFILHTQAGTLRELVHDLALGKHLG